MATNTAGTTARRYERQTTHYVRKTVNFNDAGIASGVAMPAPLPAGAVIIDVIVVIPTAFNAGTTNVLTVGTTAGGAQIVASADAAAGSTGLKRLVAATIGANAIMAADQTLYITYTQSGTPATAGQATVIVEYVVANDG